MRAMAEEGYDSRQIALSLITPQMGKKVSEKQTKLSANDKAKQTMSKALLMKKAQAKAKAQAKDKTKAEAQDSPEVPWQDSPPPRPSVPSPPPLSFAPSLFFSLPWGP